MSLAIYKPERQNLTTVDFLKDISNQVKIRDISEEDFKHHLIKTIVTINALSGIKDPMDDITKTDIKEMILMRFKALSFDEISYAFKKERYGDLAPRTEHFQLFDAKYVSEVLDKFVKWKKEKIVQYNLNHKKVEVSISEQEKEFIMAEAVDRVQKEVKQNGFISGNCSHIYDYLDKQGKLPTDVESKNRIYEQAKALARGEAATKAKYSLVDHRDLNKVIESIEKKGNSNVINISKRLVLVLRSLFFRCVPKPALPRKVVVLQEIEELAAAPAVGLVDLGEVVQRTLWSSGRDLPAIGPNFERLAVRGVVDIRLYDDPDVVVDMIL